MDMLTPADELSVVFPSDNQLGIPSLMPTMQAPGVITPVNVWGARVGRTKLTRLGGTVLFYTEDYRFRALLKDPSPVANGNFAAASEPNITISSQSPPAVAAYHVYQKRWIARYWQSRGIRILVDLNVPPDFYDLNLLGVPKGWRAYSTRGYTERLPFTVLEHEKAIEHAGTDDLVFLVYGGGKRVREAALYYGWTWIPEDVDVQKGRANALLGPVGQLALEDGHAQDSGTIAGVAGARQDCAASGG